MKKEGDKRRNKPKLYLEECKIKGDQEDYGLADDLWDFNDFKRRLKIIQVRREQMFLEFDMICMPGPIANSLRRIMLSEVPSMAIEKVLVYNNTSIIQDEVLAHRLGLVPLKADPRLFEYRLSDEGEGTENDTLEFELKYKCTRKDAQVFEKNYGVYSNQLKWLPKGRQSSMFREANIGPTEGDILLAKMKPGHELDLKVIAVKGIGKDHAKFSPVATAW